MKFVLSVFARMFLTLYILSPIYVFVVLAFRSQGNRFVPDEHELQMLCVLFCIFEIENFFPRFVAVSCCTPLVE